MACAQPWLMKNPHFNEFGYSNFWKPFLEVPCGWCLNCRVDRQNWLTDAMEYEQKNYGYSCAFVTFTYDDIHIQKLSNINTDDFYYYSKDNQLFIAPYASDKEVIYSTCVKDCQDFIKRLRRKINYQYDKNNIKNVDLCRRDFKYSFCTEYGESFGRPHAHFVFFGLDWDFCKDLFYSCWQQGLIDSKPVQSGCFEYITKYITKQVKGEMAKQMFDDKGLERPVFRHSLGLGKGIILDQFDYIKAHNYCYKTSNDTLRPLPIYYRNALFHSRPNPDYSKTNINMIQSGISSDLDKSRWYKNSKGVKIRYSLKKMNEYRKAQAILRHSKLEKECEKKGIPISPLVNNCVGQYDYSLANTALDSIVPF